MSAATTAVVPEAMTASPPNDESSVEDESLAARPPDELPDEREDDADATAAGIHCRSARRVLSTMATAGDAEHEVVAAGVHDPVSRGHPHTKREGEHERQQPSVAAYPESCGDEQDHRGHESRDDAAPADTGGAQGESDPGATRRPPVHPRRRSGRGRARAGPRCPQARGPLCITPGEGRQHLDRAAVGHRLAAVDWRAVEQEARHGATRASSGCAATAAATTSPTVAPVRVSPSTRPPPAPRAQ